MIRKLFYLLLFFPCFLLYSQEVKQFEQKNILSDSIYSTVDEMPQFPGGMNALRQIIQKNMRTNNFSGKGKMSSETTFIIDKNGKMHDIKSTGTQFLADEMTRIFSNIKVLWKPAKMNGKPVNFYHKMPMGLQFE